VYNEAWAQSLVPASVEIHEGDLAMTELLIHPEVNVVPRNAYVADGPIDFETWLCLAENLDTELIGGIMVDRMSAQFPHEWIFAWFLTLLRNYVGKRNLGVVLGSRTAVKISSHSGRLPDILFVRAENTGIIHNDAIYGVPDLVIEIVSVNDRPSDIIPLEADYRSLGVPEIMFIDPQKRRVRVVHKTDTGYDDQYLLAGRLELRALPGFWIEVEWLFEDVRPNELDVALQLLQEAAGDSK
jgi:Uma2 family endonuclease